MKFWTNARALRWAQLIFPALLLGVILLGVALYPQEGVEQPPSSPPVAAGDLGEEPGRPNPDEGFTPPPGEVTLTELLGDNAPDINSGVGSNGAWAEANGGETRCAAYTPVEVVEEAAFFVALDYFATSEEGMARVAFPEEFIRGGGYCHTVDETRECVRLYVDGDIVIGDIVRCPEPEE